jgi:hypothetical protein
LGGVGWGWVVWGGVGWGWVELGGVGWSWESSTTRILEVLTEVV